MTDYKNLKLIATSSPHIRGNETTRSLMLDVVIAMVPALVAAVIVFGIRALTLTAVSVVACIFWEWLYRKILKKDQTVGDLSAVVTGMLLAFVCPVTLPYWMMILGDAFAILLVKQLYGGIGRNFMNPALAGRAALLACYATAMTTWIDPSASKAGVLGVGADIVTAATPMAMMKEGGLAAVMETYDLQSMFVGNIGGSLGEVSALALLIGGIYLIARKVITWHIPVADLGTEAVLTVPPWQRSSDLHALQPAGRRIDAGCLLHGYRLRHLPRHQQGPYRLWYRLRSADRVHPLFRRLSRGCVLLHPDHELHHLAHRQVHAARPLRCRQG